MKVVKDSHVDHDLSAEQLAWLVKQFEMKTSFFIETVDLPAGLGTVPCGLHGPIMGDDSVSSLECREEIRGCREWVSRLCDRGSRQVTTVTVIAGPHGD